MRNKFVKTIKLNWFFSKIYEILGWAFCCFSPLLWDRPIIIVRPSWHRKFKSLDCFFIEIFRRFSEIVWKTRGGSIWPHRHFVGCISVKRFLSRRALIMNVTIDAIKRRVRQITARLLHARGKNNKVHIREPGPRAYIVLSNVLYVDLISENGAEIIKVTSKTRVDRGYIFKSPFISVCFQLVQIPALPFACKMK